MPWDSKRRKGKQGKQGNGRKTPVAPPAPSPNEEKQQEEKSSEEVGAETVGAPTWQEGSSLNKENCGTTRDEEKNQQEEEESSLVLTSEKRRGVYECDYCHSDISQLPRIRCAVCNDFDLCLDCFATTDHAAAISRLKAAATAHSELTADGIASTMVTGLSNANHDDTHGYRVCDSTRYPIFGSARSVLKLPSSGAASTTSSIKGDDDEPNETSEEGTNKDTATTIATGDESKLPGGGSSAEYRWVISDDPKSIWTAEEDLRLLDAIKTHGIGNWSDISDAVGGNGSVGKTPKRCMERYFDDFLGRYGHILPQYTIVGDNVNDEETASNYNQGADNHNEMEGMEDWEDESTRSSKRRQLARLPSNVSNSSAGGGGSRARKRYKVVPSESLPGNEDLWPNPYLPPVEGVTMGQEVARDLSTKNELTFVKLIGAASSKEEADKIREEWIKRREKQRIGAPTVLPPRPEDSASLPGAELVGFMPRRGDFDIEHENEAEQALADMEFLETDTEQEKQLKVQVLQIYYQKQNEREKRRQFILSRNLYDYRKYVKNEQDLPQDERDLRHRMRLFERFHTPEEHKQFIDDIIKAKRLRKEIAKLQMYRRIGIRSLAEAEKYELDKSRRQFHKVAQLQKEADAKQAAALATSGVATAPVASIIVGVATPSAMTSLAASSTANSMALAAQASSEMGESLWKNYRTTDRKARRSINRSGSTGSADGKDEGGNIATASAVPQEGEGGKETRAPEDAEEKDKKKDIEGAKVEVDSKDAMQVDEEKAREGTPAQELSEFKENKMQVDGDEKLKTDAEDAFDITNTRGYDLLSRREAELCMDLKIYPAQYLEIKKALIQESLRKGLLDKEGPGLGRRMVVKLDVKRRGDIIDFMLRAGWISSRLADVARTVTPPPPPTED